jgi:hypothetical protein
LQNPRFGFRPLQLDLPIWKRLLYQLSYVGFQQLTGKRFPSVSQDLGNRQVKLWRFKSVEREI